MAWQRLAERISQLPLVLAGPMLRRTDLNSVTVWVALKEPRSVTLHVYRGSGNSRTEVLTGRRDTARLGEHLHVVAVQASSSAAILSGGETYYYDLDFGNGEVLGSPGIVSMAADASARRRAFAYAPSDLPSFALPPKDISKLRLFHGSCRKPHGEGPDALAALDVVIGEAMAHNVMSSDAAVARPHLLLLTGDQVYADDVADALLEALTDAGDTLLGWAEALPPGGQAPSAFKPAQRAAVVKAAGFTAGLPHHADRRNSHLISLGEFFAMYLFAWSDVLWPPAMPEVGSKVEHDCLNQFRKTLPLVRRALANVPSYMIIDDHEITDDWFMNREWCYRVFGRPKGESPDKALPKELGKRIIQNGLAAYAVFQAWGNTPAQFSEEGPSGEPGKKLLEAIGHWRGQLDSAGPLSEIARFVGLPSAKLAPAASPKETTSLERADGHLVWHYALALPGYPFEILVLDLRTMRGYPGDAQGFPALLNGEAFREQLVKPSSSTPGQVQLTLVVSPTPYIGLTWVEHWQRKARFLMSFQWKHDAEAWGLHRKGFQTMLATLALRRTQVVVFSGDVHYGFAARVGYWARAPFGLGHPLTDRLVANVAQLTASSFKNQVTSVLPRINTDELHVDGFDPSIVFGLALKNNPLDWAAWTTRPRRSDAHLGIAGFLRRKWRPKVHTDGPSLVNVSKRPFDQKIWVKEDWLYRIQFLPGTRSATAALTAPAAGPTSADSAEGAELNEKIAKVRAEALKGKEGVEVVGVNNIGEVLFDWPPSGIPAVTQNLLWGITDEGVPTVKTAFRVSLDTADAAFEPAQVWKRRPE